MAITNITPDDLEFVTRSQLVIGDRIVRDAHPILKSIGTRPTVRQLNKPEAHLETVVTIDPYVPGPGAMNADIADSITVINRGMVTESTGLKIARVWRVKR